jgi:oligosaccharide 4-alpha-D-glucosyltransferase
VQLQISDETIPIFVKAGSIIPRVETFNTTDHYSSRKLYLHTYLPGSGLSFGGTMFEDDGATYASFETGAYELLSFQGQQGAAQLSIKFSREGNGWAGMPESRLVELILYGQNKNVREVQFGDLVLKKLEGSQEASPTPGFWHDENGIWHIRFVWHGDDKTLFIK